MAGRKVFVGSLPDGVEEHLLRAEFSKYGSVEDIYVKNNCEPGRQWSMVTYATAQQAQLAKESTDRQLQLPGSERPVEVMIARNQTKVGGSADGGFSQPQMGAQQTSSPCGSTYLPRESEAGQGPPKKIFVGSLPDGISETLLREEFSKYGQISDLYMKTTCERNKQWAFITFTNVEEAELAKSSTDRQLRFPGSDLACEVMLARNQGMNGRDPLRPGGQPVHNASQGQGQGPTKIFVGSLPDDINETLLRAEFSKYGQITDAFVKTGCETNKQWAFLVFATNVQAQQAKDATDRVLLFPGAAQPCSVMFAKHQDKEGASSASPAAPPPPAGIPAPPPLAALPPQYAWRVYQTPQGLQYYHNHTTGVTQWECPVELQYSAMAVQQAQQAQVHAAHMQQHQLMPMQVQVQPGMQPIMAAPTQAMPVSQPGYAPSPYGAMYPVAQPQAALYRPY